jgi:hypothetical protein
VERDALKPTDAERCESVLVLQPARTHARRPCEIGSTSSTVPIRTGSAVGPATRVSTRRGFALAGRTCPLRARALVLRALEDHLAVGAARRQVFSQLQGLVAGRKREFSVGGFARAGLVCPQERRWPRCSGSRIPKRYCDLPAVFVEPDRLIADEALIGAWERRHLFHARQERRASLRPVLRSEP